MFERAAWSTACLQDHLSKIGSLLYLAVEFKHDVHLECDQRVV